MKYKKLNDREEAIVMVTLGVPIYYLSGNGEYVPSYSNSSHLLSKVEQVSVTLDYYVREGSDDD